VLQTQIRERTSIVDDNLSARPNLTRRALLKGVAGLSAGAAALALPGVSLARWSGWPHSTLPVASYSASVATEWFRLVLQLIQTTPGFSPPVASRAFGYLGVALYEALTPGMPGYRSLAGQLNGLPALPLPPDHAYHWPTVANSALAATIRAFLPTTPDANQTAVTDLERGFADTFARRLPPAILERSIKRGQTVAAHIFAWSRSDGGHEGYLTNFPAGYVPPAGPGLWVPTPPGFQPALQPYWGNNRPFVLASGAEHDPGPPPSFSTAAGSPFHAEAVEVYETVNALTDEQRAIALFWADDPGQTATPPGHSLAILTQLLEERQASLAAAAEAYAKAGMAVADAFIGCWHSKYTYHLIRPISYIQQHLDPGWGVEERALPVTTPPFPEYTSGHSAQTGAFAQVLFDLFGDFPFTDHTHDARGLAPRSFSSCFEMAEETAISRLYGGIHFRAAIERGIEQGRAIGKRVSGLKLGPG
jgi:hypothetical protein